MRKLLFLFPILLFADVNPFAAGVNSGYGLTPDEKVILQNKRNIESLQKEVLSIKNKLIKIDLKLANYDDIINSKLSALPTIVDEINNAMNDILILKKKYVLLYNDLNQTKSQILELTKKINVLEKKIDILNATLNAVIETQNQNYENLKITYINLKTAYMKLKDMFEKFLKKYNETNLTPKEAFKKAKQYFFNGNLDKAKELFLYSLSKKYLPATSSYYLGEIAFKEKNYEEALGYYKKSIEFYPKKTSFTPQLLYHTAISFLKLGNKEGAKITFKKLVNDFPDSKYSDLAKKELEKLK